MSFRELLNKGPFFLDGGMGTLLQAEGLKPGEAPESWNLTHPEAVRDVAGLKTDGGAIIFSLPVDDLVGIGRFEEYIDGEEEK